MRLHYLVFLCLLAFISDKVFHYPFSHDVWIAGFISWIAMWGISQVCIEAAKTINKL